MESLYKVVKEVSRNEVEQQLVEDRKRRDTARAEMNDADNEIDLLNSIIKAMANARDDDD